MSPFLRRVVYTANGTPLPLLKERVHNLRGAGFVLESRFNGSIETLLKGAQYNAPSIASLVSKYFPSFQDVVTLKTGVISFFKRAQIFAYDVSLLPGIKIANLNQLTIFADYKLPQILRHYGILHYQAELASRVDTKTILPKGSREEVEIRSATIWAGELLAHRLKVVPAVVDNILWSMGTSVRGPLRPYHRVVTTAY